MKVKVYATEVRYRYDLIYRIEVAAADILPGQLVPASAQFDVPVGRVFKRREATPNICCDYAQYSQCADKSPPHEQSSTQKEVSVCRNKTWKEKSALFSKYKKSN